MTRRPKAIVDAVRSVFEPLERRRLLTIVSLTGGGGSADYAARLNPTTQNVDISVDQNLIQSVPLASFDGIQLQNPGGYDDSFTADVPGRSFSLEVSGVSDLGVNVTRGDVIVNTSQSLGWVQIGSGGSLTMSGSGTTLIANGISVGGQFQHSGGTLNTPHIQIIAGGAFIDAGGSIAHTGGLTIDNSGTFKAAFAGSLANTTGTFHDAGHFIEDVGAGNTNTIGMSFVNNGMSFNLVSGTVRINTSFDTYSDLNIDGTNGTLSVPFYSNTAGHFTQTGGTFSVDNEFWIGNHFATGASFSMTAGVINTPSFLVSSFSNNATFAQSGGAINASNQAVFGFVSNGGTWSQTGGVNHYKTFIVGTWSATASIYNLSGGSITTDAANIGYGGEGTLNLSGNTTFTATQAIVGAWSGTGTVNQAGGTSQLGTLNVGYVLSGTGTYNLSGGSLTDQEEYIAFANNQAGLVQGKFVQTGGAHQSGWLCITYGNGGDGSYEMRGGQLSATYLTVAAGRFLQTDGQTVIGAQLLVANLNNSGATFDLSGGSVTVQGNSYIGYASSGTVNHSGGSLVIAGDLYVSGDGRDGFFSNGHGTYNLSGTAILTAQNEFIGYSADGTLNQSGGTQTTNYLVYNGPSGTVGTVNRVGGALNAAHIIDVVRPSAGGASIVDEGSPYTLNLSATSAIGHNAIDSWAINWGDQNTEPVSGNPSSRSHTYLAGGVTRTIHPTAFGGGQTYPADPVGVLIHDVPADIAPIASQTADAGDPVSLSTTFTDPGIGLAHTAIIDWGDGTIDTQPQLTESGHTGSVSGSHAFTRHGTYTGTLTVTDSGGAVSSMPFTINVNYVAPTIEIATPQYVSSHNASTLILNAFGPESRGITKWQIEWGDGTSSTIDHETGTYVKEDHTSWTKTHFYAAAGVYSITAHAEDDESLAGFTHTTTLRVLAPDDESSSNNGGPDTDVSSQATPPEGKNIAAEAGWYHLNGYLAFGTPNYSLENGPVIQEILKAEKDWQYWTNPSDALDYYATTHMLKLMYRDGVARTLSINDPIFTSTGQDFYNPPTNNYQTSIFSRTVSVALGQLGYTSASGVNPANRLTFQITCEGSFANLGVDSNNDGISLGVSLTSDDNQVENQDGLPGMVLGVKADGDVPPWAYYARPSTETKGVTGLPYSISYLSNYDLTEDSTVTFYYPGSDPSGVTSMTEDGITSFHRNDNGKIRLFFPSAQYNATWQQSDNLKYIVPGQAYSWKDVFGWQSGAVAIQPISPSSAVGDIKIYLVIRSASAGASHVLAVDTVQLTISSLRVEDREDHGVELSWAGISGMPALELWRAQNSWQRLATPSANTNSYFDFTVIPNQSYSYQLRVANPYSSTVARSPTVLARTAPPPAINLSATFTAGQVTLSWQSKDSTIVGVTYKIYRTSDSEVLSYKLLTTTTSLSFTDQDIAPSTTYRYLVLADNGGAVSTQEEEVYVRTPGAVEPSAVDNIGVIVNNSSIEINWLDLATNAAYLRIERADSSSAQFLPLALIPPLADSFIDRNLDSGQLYRYRIVSVNPAGEAVSVQSDPIVAPALAIGQHPVGPISINSNTALPGFTNVANMSDNERSIIVRKFGNDPGVLVNLDIYDKWIVNDRLTGKIDFSVSVGRGVASFFVYTFGSYTDPTFVARFDFDPNDQISARAQYDLAKTAAVNGTIHQAATTVGEITDTSFEAAVLFIPGPQDAILGAAVSRVIAKIGSTKAIKAAIEGGKWVFRNRLGQKLGGEALKSAEYEAEQLLKKEISSVKWERLPKHDPRIQFSKLKNDWKKIVDATKTGDAMYRPDVDIELVERIGWEQGTAVPMKGKPGTQYRIYEFDKMIGANGGKETRYIRVEQNSTGSIHGHPLGETKWKQYQKDIANAED